MRKIDFKNLKYKDIGLDIGTLLIGSFLFATSINVFFLPGGVIVGGITGISTVLHLLFKTPIGVSIIILNLPLLFMYGRYFGYHRLLKTILSVIFTSVATDLITFLPVSNQDPLICAILGGVTMGFGCGILFTRGFTTGGTDLMAYILRRRFKNISTGRFILLIDVIIIISASFFTKNFIGIFYSVIAIFLWSKVVDFVLNSSNTASLVFIMSEKYEEIADEVLKGMTRGVTVLVGKGWYTKSDRHVLMCAVKRTEIYRIKILIKGIDPKAFVIYTEANEVLGEGFNVE